MAENLLFAPFVSVLIAVRQLPRLIHQIQTFKAIFLTAVRCFMWSYWLSSKEFPTSSSIRSVWYWWKNWLDQTSTRHIENVSSVSLVFLSITWVDDCSRESWCGWTCSSHFSPQSPHQRCKNLNIHPTGAVVDVALPRSRWKEPEPGDTSSIPLMALGGWKLWSAAAAASPLFTLFAPLASGRATVGPTDHRVEHMFTGSLEPWRTGPSDLVTSIRTLTHAQINTYTHTDTHIAGWEINVHAQTHYRCLIYA